MQLMSAWNNSMFAPQLQISWRTTNKLGKKTKNKKKATQISKLIRKPNLDGRKTKTKQNKKQLDFLS